MSAADSEAQKARFSDYVRQHPVLAAGSAIAAGGLAAYLAESNGLSLPVAAGIGVAGATSAVLLSSLAYLERPAYVQDHPYIAGFQFVGVTGVSAFFIEELTGGLVEIPIAVLLGSLFGVGAVALTAAGYDWFKSWFPTLPKVPAFVKELGEAFKETGEAIASGEVTTATAEGIKGFFGYAGSDLNLDEIAQNGNDEERAVIKKIMPLFGKMTMTTITQAETDELNQLVAQLNQLLAENYQDNWGRPMVSTADARFTTNHDNPVVQQERAEDKSYSEIIADERALTNTYNEQHKEEVDAFVEEVHDMTVEEIQARAKAGPFAQGPKK